MAVDEVKLQVSTWQACNITCCISVDYVWRACSTGVGQTAVFVTLSLVLERMRFEGVVDMFQTVNVLRTQRPSMVHTEARLYFTAQLAAMWASLHSSSLAMTWRRLCKPIDRMKLQRKYMYLPTLPKLIVHVLIIEAVFET